MKILIVGSGVIGTIYGWALAKAGHDVIHLVRSEKTASLSAGISIDMIDQRKGQQKYYLGTYPIKTTETLNPTEPFELVIVPVKPDQLIKTLQQIVPQTGQANYLLLTQNWNGTAEIDAIIPATRYVYGDAKAGGSFKNGKLIAALFATIDLGQTSKQPNECIKNAEHLFLSAGIKPVVQKNILQYIWIQYAINAGLWPALVRAGSFTKLLRDSRTIDLALLAVKECLDVVTHRGVDLTTYPETKLYLNTHFLRRKVVGLALRLMFRYNKSIQRSSSHALADPLEIKNSFYDLLTTGQQFGVPMPILNSFKSDIDQFTNKIL